MPVDAHPTPALGDLDALIAELEARIRHLPVATQIMPDTDGCTHGCTYNSCDDTNGCTNDCTHDCTHGCTGTC